MKRAALVLVILLAGATAAQASTWRIVGRLSRPYCGLVVFHVENHGDAVRYVTLKAGRWERFVALPSWGGVHIEKAFKRPASVWFRGEPFVRHPGCA